MKFSLNPETVSALHLNHVVAAAPDKVYKAWTSADVLAKWWLPEGARTVKIDTVAKVDGPFALRYRTPSGDEVTQDGVWVQVDEQMLVLNLGPDSMRKKEGGTLVTVELRKAEKGTQLSVTHEGLPDAATQERYRGEWLRRLARLDKVLA